MKASQGKSTNLQMVAKGYRVADTKDLETGGQRQYGQNN